MQFVNSAKRNIWPGGTFLDTEIGGLLSRLCEIARTFAQYTQEFKDRHPGIQRFDFESCQAPNVGVSWFIVKGRRVSLVYVV